MALAHFIGNKAERAYRRGRALAKRRGLIEAWDTYCLGRSAMPETPNLALSSENKQAA